MPCYTVQRTQTQLGKDTNPDYMLAALNALKLNAVKYANGIRFDNGNFQIKSGLMTLNDQGPEADQMLANIKRAYMTQATIATVQRFGFQIKANGPNKFQAIKRTM